MKNKILKKVKFEFKSLKAFDMIWLGVCVIGITIVALNTSNSLLAIISSIMGVIYVILNGCRLSVAFLFGMINTFIYAIVSYQNGLYGDFVMNLFYSFPCCIIGFILWFRASKENMITRVSSFKKNERIIFITIIILSILIFGMILSFFKDTQPYLDATTTVLSMSAYICLIKRKKEVWYLFNLSNILSILMWFINYISSNANISILFMYIIYTVNSLINTVRWESSNRPVVEIDILFYKGVLDLEWMKKILDFQEDITINIYLYHQELKSKDQRIHIKKIPYRIKNFGQAYNYIISKARGKYFMLLDNLDYINPHLFHKIMTKDLLNKQYEMIKSNTFYVKEEEKLKKIYDDYTGTNAIIEEKIMNREIFPYFFGSRLYSTKFIKKKKIKFNHTDIYNDIYPNILLARTLNMDKVEILNIPFYTRYRLKWESFHYHKNDLRVMISSLMKINVPKEKILIRLVDSYNYSVNERGYHNHSFLDIVVEFYDIEEFNLLLNQRNKKMIYKNK